VPAETHTQRGPLDRAAVSELILDRLAELLGLDEGALSEADRLADLGVDDIVLVDLAELLEDELGERTIGFHIDDEDLQELETVRDAIDDVLSRLA
jgi:acyl carrier protein